MFANANTGGVRKPPGPKSMCYQWQATLANVTSCGALKLKINLCYIELYSCLRQHHPIIPTHLTTAFCTYLTQNRLLGSVLRKGYNLAICQLHWSGMVTRVQKSVLDNIQGKTFTFHHY